MTPCSSSSAGIVSAPTLSQGVNLIFQYAATPTPDPATNLPPADISNLQGRKILDAQYAALNLLARQAERWTKIKEIDLDGANKARIAITYLSPELLEAVLQNHILAHAPHRVNVWETIQKELDQVYRRDELIFLVTVIPDSQASSRHTIDLNPRQLILRNTNDYAVAPMHDDHNLEIPIDLSDGPEFGFINYPISVTINGGCENILDRESNTKINIETQTILVDSVSKGPYVWMIHYAPLVETGISFFNPQYPDGITAVDPAMFLPLPAPPITDEEDVNFWRDFGRFIWGQITLENH
jgi:hypothetical protein